LIIKGLSA